MGHRGAGREGARSSSAQRVQRRRLQAGLKVSAPKTDAEKLLDLQRDATELVTGWNEMERFLAGLEDVDLEEPSTPTEASDDSSDPAPSAPAAADVASPSSR